MLGTHLNVSCPQPEYQEEGLSRTCTGHRTATSLWTLCAPLGYKQRNNGPGNKVELGFGWTGKGLKLSLCWQCPCGCSALTRAASEARCPSDTQRSSEGCIAMGPQGMSMSCSRGNSVWVWEKYSSPWEQTLKREVVHFPLLEMFKI